jgi:hypothetical protein
MKTTIDHSLLINPLFCSGCSRSIISTNVLIDPPQLGALPEIAEVFDWFRWAAELPRSETPPLRMSAGGREASSIRWKCLEIAGRNPAPAALGFDPPMWEHHELVMASFNETTLTAKCLDENNKRHRRNLRFNDIFWRSLEKALPAAERPSLGCSPCLKMFFQLGPSQCGEEELALLLLRYTMESVCSVMWFPETSILRYLSESRANESVVRSLGCWSQSTALFTCSTQQELWLQDRFILEFYRAVFAAALEKARTMVQIREFHWESLLQSFAVYKPYCMGMFNAEKRLEFWSLRFRLDPKWNSLDRRLGIRSVSIRDVNV